jgi:hypothetical protein
LVGTEQFDAAGSQGAASAGGIQSIVMNECK